MPPKAASSSDDKFAYILTCLSHAEALQINFRNVCAETGITIPGNAARKFKQCVEATGKYKFADGKVTCRDSIITAPPTPPVGNRGGSKRSAVTADVVNDDGDDGEDAVEVPVKKARRATKTTNAKGKGKGKKKDADSNLNTKNAVDDRVEEVNGDDTEQEIDDETHN